MNDNVLTSYSFLAALSENETDIYKTVYLPLFKRAISSYAAKKSSKVSNSIQGTDIDIQSIILEEYGIEVPILIVRKLIKAVGTSLSKKERNIFKFDIFEDGKETRDFVFIEDVVDATILGLETKEAAGHAFNIGTGVSTDVLTVANTLCEKYNIKVPISISGNYRLGDIRHNYADITLARTILGYEPKWSFSDGIGEFCKWVNTQEIQADMYDASILEMKEKGLYK